MMCKVTYSSGNYVHMSLQPKTNATDQASVVMEVIFSDTKKTIIIRSPLQVGVL